MCRSFTYLVRQIEGNALDYKCIVAEDGCQFGIHGKELDKLLLPFIPRCFFSFSAGDVWILLYSFTLPTETANLPRRGLP